MGCLRISEPYTSLAGNHGLKKSGGCAKLAGVA